MKNKRRLKYLMIGLFILIAGLFVFVFVSSLYYNHWFSTFTYNKDIEPFDVFNLIISGFIAIGLGYYITKKLTEQRFMKEFIINDITKVEEELENVENLLSTASIELETIFSALNKLNHKIERIENTAKLISFECEEIDKMKSLHLKIYLIATASDVSTRIITSSLNYNLAPVYNDFSKSLRKMVYLINKI